MTSKLKTNENLFLTGIQVNKLKRNDVIDSTLKFCKISFKIKNLRVPAVLSKFAIEFF